MSDEDANRIEAHAEAMRAYGPVPDYTTAPYLQVVAFERGAAFGRRQAALEAAREVTQ